MWIERTAEQELLEVASVFWKRLRSMVFLRRSHRHRHRLRRRFLFHVFFYYSEVDVESARPQERQRQVYWAVLHPRMTILPLPEQGVETRQ